MPEILATADPSVKQLKSAGLAALLLSVYVFMLYSRVFEATMLIGLPNLYLILGLSVIALLCVVFKGGIARAAKTPCGVLLLLFTLWAVFILPFSSWKSESLHELTDVWLKSAAAFFIIAGLTTKFADSRRVFAAVGYGAAASALVVALTNRNYGGRETSLGSLGNANEVAFHIAFGLPFMVLLMSRVKMIFKIPLAAVILLSLALSMKTASREGLVITITIVVVAVLKVSFQNKLKIVTVAAIGLVVALLTADQTQLERYGTIFNSSSSSAEALSAKESADSRKHKLEQSLELTLTHPLTGVGMGVFIPAAAEMSKARGEHQDWLASHNSYTQISSETGVLGFLIILAVFAVTLSALLKLHRTARRLNLKEVQSMALCMLLSSVALSIHFFFDAIPYEFYLPMVAALATSLVSTSRPLIAEAEASLRRNETASESGLLPMTVPAGIAAGSIAKVTGPLRRPPRSVRSQRDLAKRMRSTATPTRPSAN